LAVLSFETADFPIVAERSHQSGGISGTLSFSWHSIAETAGLWEIFWKRSVMRRGAPGDARKLEEAAIEVIGAGIGVGIGIAFNGFDPNTDSDADPDGFWLRLFSEQ
jgi:hypothetical protein